LRPSSAICSSSSTSLYAGSNRSRRWPPRARPSWSNAVRAKCWPVWTSAAPKACRHPISIPQTLSLPPVQRWP